MIGADDPSRHREFASADPTKGAQDATLQEPGLSTKISLRSPRHDARRATEVVCGQIAQPDERTRASGIRSNGMIETASTSKRVFQYLHATSSLRVTAHPTAEWIARQLTEACGWELTPSYVIRDRTASTARFKRRLRAMGIRDRPIAPRSPWLNGHAERLNGSIRRECLDHVVVFGERHLRHILLCYMTYYTGARTHLSLNKDAPIPRAVQAAGRILATPTYPIQR
jgi:transposase InsO family protein